MNIYVSKKDGTLEKWDFNKVIAAADKAASRANADYPAQQFKDRVDTKLAEVKGNYTMRTSEFMLPRVTIPTAVIHSLVIDALKEVSPKVAEAYQEYRDYKNTYAKEFEKIKTLADGVLLLGDKENANFDSSLVSTKGSLIKGYLTKSLYNQFFLSKKEKELTKRGDIYIHDLRDMMLNCINCCLFDMGAVLKGGFTMSNIQYTEPTSVLSALQVIGDITLVATAQQFGGFTIPEIDKVLAPYCKKTYDEAYDEAYDNFGLDTYEAENYALKHLWRELEQGFQSLELKLNTVPCSRGDFAFTTITFGHLSDNPEDRKWQPIICEALLAVRMKGHGGKHVVFPKLVYLYDEEQHSGSDPLAEHVFDRAVRCSSKCMYPDYLSLTGDPENNMVAKVYKASNGKAITSPMGCRAYLSPWIDPETDKFVTVGRCNIGAVSLNIPLLIAIAKNTTSDWKNEFWSILANRLEVIRQFFQKRYATLAKVKASTNPMCFMQGGLYNGHLKANDTIEPLLPYMTASFGVTALNEASILWDGTPLSESNAFAKTVLEFIQAHIDIFKEEDGYLYAIYGTPAESLCHTQAKQYAAYTGDTQFGTYFSNSFHCHVSSEINPAEKQDLEHECFHMCNGGHIQYVRIDNPENTKALKAIIKRGMEMGFYQGVNFDAAYCEDCHMHSTNVLDECPHCHSRNISVISRVCGYLGYSNVNGETRMNEGKMAEIHDRVSM